MGHGKPPPRRCGKGYRTGRYSKPIVAPRARGKKLCRGGGDPNGFLISSFCFVRCLSASESPISAVRSETKAVRSFTKSIRSVMGITSRRMEGTARHMELPSTMTSLSNCSHKYEYMFDNNSDAILAKSSLSLGCQKAALGAYLSARAPILTAM